MSMTEGLDETAKNLGDEKLPFLGVGVYPELEIERVIQGKSFAGEDFFKVVVKVIKSEGALASAPGMSVCQIIKKDKFGYYKKDILRFAAAALNEPANTLTKTMVDEMTAADQPAKGVKLRAVVTPKEGTIYTNVRWAPLENIPAAVAATANNNTKSNSKRA